MNSDEKNDMTIHNVVTELHNYELDELSDELPDGLRVSDRFKDNMLDEITRLGTKSNVSLRLIRTAACFIAVIAIGAFVVTTNEDVGANCMDFIREFINGGLTKYEGYNNPDKISEDSDADGEIVGYKLSYVPEGFELVDRELAEKNEIFDIYFYEKGNVLLSFKCVNSNKSNHSFDNEQFEHKVVILENGMKCDYYKGVNGKKEDIIVSKRGGFVCYLSIDDFDEKWNEEELFKIANQIKPLLKE